MLELKELYKTFNPGTINAKTALNGLSLTLNDGDFVTVIGGNGAGKSTTLKLLSGMKKPQRGTLSVKGTLGMLPQNPQTLFVKKTVREDLFEIFSGTKTPRPQQEERVARMVALCRLEDLLDRHPYDLSGGEQQMLAVGRALMSRPKLLMLDEPSLGLAPLVVQGIFDIIRTVNQQGMTVLLIEQNANMALKIADYAYVLETGNITKSGTGAELLADESIKEAYLGKKKS